jgi:hypothetical protein
LREVKRKHLLIARFIRRPMVCDANVTIARVRDGRPWLWEQTPPYESSLPEPATPPPRYRSPRHAAAPAMSSSRAGAIRARSGCRKSDQNAGGQRCCGVRQRKIARSLPNDLKEFHDQAGCVAAKLPNPLPVVNILTLLLESERCAIRSWSAVCGAYSERGDRTGGLVHSNCWRMSATESRCLPDISGAANPAQPRIARTAASTIHNVASFRVELRTPEGMHTIACGEDEFIWNAAARSGIGLPAPYA